MSEVSKVTETGETSASRQCGRVRQQIAGVQERLERKGIGAAFYRAAKPDPVGDMGFMGSLLFHAVLCGPLEELLGGNLAAAGAHELNSAMALGVMEGVSMLSETQEERHIRRPKSAFYPLGRNKKSVITGRKADKTAVTSKSRLSADVQAELAYMFELTDMLSKLEEKAASEVNSKCSHFIVRKSASSTYKGVERRRRPRPEGMFSA